MRNDLFNPDHLVKVWLKPPYMIDNGKPSVPTDCIVTIIVRDELYVQYPTTAKGSVPAGLPLYLFNLRALARNKGAKVDVFLEANEMSTAYAYAKDYKPQKTLDITDRFPKPTYHF